MARTKYGAVEPDILLKEIGLLNVQELINFETAVIVHKSLNDSAPERTSEGCSEANKLNSF